MKGGGLAVIVTAGTFEP